jgi:glutamate-1-semialdehyde 2,1-aminomutase
MATIEQDYADARPKSKALHERAVKRMPSGVAHDGRSFTPFPFYVARADGARKWDVDGHEYIDCWSGHGALMLGHNHPAVLKAILEQAKLGTHYSACSEIEVRWAELICSIVPGAERVRFMMTGTETTALAIRVARAFTGRQHIVKFEAHFHGLHDAVMAAVKDPRACRRPRCPPRWWRATTTSLTSRSCSRIMKWPRSSSSPPAHAP